MSEIIKGKLLFFKDYWQTNLNNRLENILTIERLRKKYQKKSVIIGLLVYEYRKASIDTAILKMYEVLNLYRKLDKDYKLEGYLKEIVFYRNKLIAHVEENNLDPKKRKTALKEYPCITDKIKIIRKAADDLINMIDKYFERNNFEKETTCGAAIFPKIEEEALITLFEAIPEQDESAFEPSSYAQYLPTSILEVSSRNEHLYS